MLRKKLAAARTAVANLLRLLNLPQQIREYVSRETLTMGQVKPLLSLDNEKQQLEVAAAIIEKRLEFTDSGRRCQRAENWAQIQSY